MAVISTVCNSELPTFAQAPGKHIHSCEQLWFGYFNQTRHGNKAPFSGFFNAIRLFVFHSLDVTN